MLVVLVSDKVVVSLSCVVVCSLGGVPNQHDYTVRWGTPRAQGSTVEATSTPRERTPLADQLAEQIAAGVLTGSLPTEREGAELFGVSRNTVRKAYRELANDGRIRSVRGHGWYVRRDDVLRYPLLTIDKGHATAIVDVWLRFLESIGRAGDHVSHDPWQEVPPPKIRELLRLKPDEETVVRHRIRRVEGEPWMLSTAYFPAYIARDTPLAVERDMQNPAPLRWLAENGHRITRDEDVIGARMPTRDEIRHLKLHRGTPVLTNYRTSWDAAGRRVRCTADTMGADKFELVVTQDNAHEPPASDTPFGLDPTRT